MAWGDLQTQSAVRRVDSMGKWHLIGFDDTMCGQIIYSHGMDYRPATSLDQADLCWYCRKQSGLVT